MYAKTKPYIRDESEITRIRFKTVKELINHGQEFGIPKKNIENIKKTHYELLKVELQTTQ